MKKELAALPCSEGSWMSQTTVECPWWTVATWINSDAGLKWIAGLVLFSELVLEAWNLKQTKHLRPWILGYVHLVCSPPTPPRGAQDSSGAPTVCLVSVPKQPLLGGLRALPLVFLVEEQCMWALRLPAPAVAHAGGILSWEQPRAVFQLSLWQGFGLLMVSWHLGLASCSQLSRT